MTATADLQQLHIELKKLKKMPPWGRTQGDHWDRLSNFIYTTYTLREVWHEANVIGRREGIDIEAFGAYAVRRWYNHHTHDQILRLFYDHPAVRKEANKKHHSIDFYFRDLPFDLKISRFPQGYRRPFDYAQANPHHLAQWLYTHQSKERRYHVGHRLFLILHDSKQPALSWRLRRDFKRLDRLIRQFLDAPTILGLTLSHQHTNETHSAWTAIIFHTL